MSERGKRLVWETLRTPQSQTREDFRRVMSLVFHAGLPFNHSSLHICAQV